MNGERVNSFLETERIPRLLLKYSVPCVISLVVAALYNIVDQIFIANADYLGSFGNAANTVVFPLTVAALAVAVMIGGGCCTFVSISLGAGERGDASRSIGNAVMLCIALGLALTACCFIFMERTRRELLVPRGSASFHRKPFSRSFVALLLRMTVGACRLHIAPQDDSGGTFSYTK